MSRSRRRHRGFARDAAPNLAPLVDVVMVILIFLMLGSAFAVNELGLSSRLPNDVGPEAGPGLAIIPPVQIGLLGGSAGQPCRIEVMGQPLADNSFDSLESLLKDKAAAGLSRDGRVVISAGSSVAYRHVVSAMDACVRAGFANVQFAIQTKNPVGATRAAGS